MADMHPNEQEKQRLLALSGGAPWERVEAILTELGDRNTEWDDAGRALEALVEDERAEVERLRAAGLVSAAEKADLRAKATLARVAQETAADQVQRVRDLLPEIDGTFRRLCERLSTEDQEALAEVHMALKHNLDATPDRS